MHRFKIEKRRAVTVIGYVLFVVTVLLLFRLLTFRWGMDTLIPHLLSNCVGLLILYYVRRISRTMNGASISTREYGAFLLINAIVVLVSAALLYTMDVSVVISIYSVQLYSTLISLAANIVLHIVQHQEQ